MEWLFLGLGLCLGAVIAWLLMRSVTRAQRELMQQQLAARDQQFEQMKASFDSLSRTALEQNSESFLRLARSTLDTIVATAKGDLGQQHEAIKGTIKPLSDALNKYDEQIKEIENKRERSYGELSERIKAMREAEKELLDQTSSLAGALRRPEVRGQWGELTLRRTVELAGLSAHCAFAEQVTTGSGGAADRPDLVVTLPGDREIIVDAKASMQHYVDAQSEADDQSRAELLVKHATAVKSRVRDLAGKDYQTKFAKAADIVVLFLPQEAFYAAAVDTDKGLLEEAANKNVFIASPTILITLLRAVALGWREEQLRENARQISELGSEIHDRIATWLSHYAGVGKALNKATESFNDSLRSLESRVMVSARKFKELGATSKEELPAIVPVEKSPQSPSLFDQE